MVEYQEANNIAGNVETTVLSFTNTGTIKAIESIGAEGSARSYWFVYLNLNKIMQFRTSVKNPRFEIDFFDLELAVNDILEVKVEHFESTLNDFSGEVYFG